MRFLAMVAWYFGIGARERFGSEATWRRVEEACLQVQIKLDQTSEPVHLNKLRPEDLNELPPQSVQSDRVASAVQGAIGPVT